MLHVDPVTLLISESGNPLLGTLVASFSFMAIATSFLGTVMGVSETIYSEGNEILDSTRGGDASIETPSPTAAPSSATTTIAPRTTVVTDDSEDLSSTNAFSDATIRNASLALTLVPPLLFTTWGDPSSFISALSLAGGYGMTLLYGILPPMMAFVNRREVGSGRLLEGGEGLLFFMWAAGCGFFGLRLVEDLL